MNEYAIEVENLCIQYKDIKAHSIKKNLLRWRRKQPEIMAAVKNVSFKVKKGEILGIVGKNGSGKSTMLRAIAGIFSPNSGRIDLHGHSVSLLSIGVGFQKELSGRENILLSGMLLGFSKQEIQERMDEIIEFSELGNFIDKPVKTYSSGMHSKLAFSITAILETDIMLIDEVLSVGDLHFKRKSYQKMKQLINDEDRTVVIVSHERRTLSELCTKILWINDGELVRYGDTAEVLAEYETFMTKLYPEQAPQFEEFSAGATEDDVAYQWQFRLAPNKPWRFATIATSKSPILKIPKTRSRNGRQFRCKVTDRNGNVRYSEVQTMHVE